MIHNFTSGCAIIYQGGGDGVERLRNVCNFQSITEDSSVLVSAICLMVRFGENVFTGEIAGYTLCFVVTLSLNLLGNVWPTAFSELHAPLSIYNGVP